MLRKWLQNKVNVAEMMENETELGFTFILKNIISCYSSGQEPAKGGPFGTLKSVFFVGQEAALGGGQTHNFSLTIAQLVNPLQ